ncbi:MAG TPA: hypothetical protein VHZ50_18385, partial [Puia sp.]|nr:hypothetical protein [Puia sp.]
DNNLSVLSALLDIPVDVLSQQPASIVLPLVDRIMFITVPPVVDVKKSKIRWKDINSLTYDNFIMITKCIDKSLEKSEYLIAAMMEDEMSSDDILELSMSEIQAGFFLLVKHTQKSIRTSSRYLMRKLMSSLVKQGFHFFRKKFSRK